MASTARKQKPARKNTTGTAVLPVVMIPVERIDPSPLNREATVDLAPLVDSIRQHGLQQAIKVRPIGDRYEIVYGERRWRAVKKLEHAEIPATVETLSDDEAQEKRILENTQRTDPHALEEAESYERLLAMKDSKGQPLHRPETVAKLAGRSIGHVYNRLKLTALAPELRKALYKNELTLTAAFLVARGIPTALQAEAWAKLQEYAQDCYEEELDDEERLTAHAVQNFIDHEYSSRLDSAPFSLKDTKLLPGASSCQACPKRSGNQPQLFGEADRKDICTDLSCFRTKLAAYVAREKERVLSIGGAVLTEEESRRVFAGGATLPYNSKWVDLDSPCFDDPQRRTWRQVLGDLCPAPTLAFTSQAKPMLLAEKASVLSTLEAHGLDPASLRAKATPAKKGSPAAAQKTAAPGDAPRAVHPDDPDEDEDLEADEEDAQEDPATPADARLAADIARGCRLRVMAEIVKKAEAAAPDDNRFVQLVYDTMLRGGFHNSVTDSVKRRIGNKRPKGEHVNETLQAHVRGLDAAGLRALVLELALSRSGYYVGADSKYSHDMTRAIELYALDVKAIEAEVSADLSAKRAARLAKAKSAGA